jgi:hypothetical protein
LKWLKISCYEFDEYVPKKQEQDAVFLTDTVFVNVFSLMPLEYLDFQVYIARVIFHRVHTDHYGGFIVFQQYANNSSTCIVIDSFFIVVMYS